MPELVRGPEGGIGMVAGDSPQCDFCNELNPTWKYPAASFRADALGLSVGDWAACETCHTLIESGDLEGLHTQSAKTHFLVKAGDVTAEEILEFIVPLHQQFLDARTGPAERI